MHRTADEEKNMSNGLRAPGHNSQLRLRQAVTKPTQGKTEQNEVVRQESRSETLAEFCLLAASLAHEIRNSLAGVRGAAEVLKSDYAEQTEQRLIFNEILRRLDGVNKLAGDLLEYSKPLIAKKQVLHLLESLEAVVTALTGDPRLQCVTMVKEYRCDPVLRADPSLLERLFLNLTLNAVQAMKFCGELTVRVVESKKNVSISFIDKGCGMDKDIQEKIFGPFFTTKASGTGLGLFLCKKYVEAHEGSIEVKTEPGLGSTFTVFLPRGRRLAHLAKPADPVACQVTETDRRRTNSIASSKCSLAT
jgi:signal transduction histidine kinase